MSSFLLHLNLKNINITHGLYSNYIKYINILKVHPMPSFFHSTKYKRFLLYSLLFLFLSIPILSLILPKPKITFRRITDQLFFEDITTDTLSLHYTLAYPFKYSIDTYPITLPKYNKNNLNQSKSKIENIICTLSDIDISKLSIEETYCHKLLQDYFSTQAEGFSFTYFEECFSPSSGIVANYPILMAEYTFRRQKDVTDYLTLLKDTPNYFSTYLTFQKERAISGYYPASVSLQETMEQCDTIITQESLDANSHFLQITFRERLAYLVAKNTITKEEAFRYIEENNLILKNIVYPSYQKLKNSLSVLQKKEQPLQGLYKKKQGKEYYQWLIKKQTGCSLSIPEMLRKLEIDYEKNLLEFQYLQKKIQSFQDYETYITNPFPLEDKNEILKTLQNLMKRDFPSLSSYSEKPIKTTIKSVSNCMEEYTSPAFYLLPPIDDIWQNTIYINNSSTPVGLDLFTTLAHEGYPGHLYQTVFYQLYSKQEDIPLIRHIMNYEGYVEGWAIYCEFMAYHYATELYPEENREFYTLWHQLLLTDRKMQLSLLSILDIKLHYYNDSLETAKDILSQYGITDDKTIQDIHQYILEEPGNYLKYYIGYLLLMDLKEKTETLMGSAFSKYTFHEIILKAGPSDFDNLEKRLLENFISIHH